MKKQARLTFIGLGPKIAVNRVQPFSTEGKDFFFFLNDFSIPI